MFGTNMGAYKRPRLKKRIKDSIEGWIFVLPLVLGLAFFTVYPMTQSLLYSFYEYDGIRFSAFVGLDNFAAVFKDYEFLTVVKNTAVYSVLSIPISLVLSYLLALLVSRGGKKIMVFRVLYYLPCVIPGVIGGVVWMAMLNADGGAFNTILAYLHLPTSTFFSDASTAMASLILMGCWNCGGGMIMWLSSMKSIPSELYEAAEVDGFNVFQRVLFITIPLSTPMIFYNLVTGVIGALQINNTMVFAGNSGKGPESSLYFLGVKIYNEAFQNWSMGYACALSWVLFAVIALLTGIIFKTGGWVYYGDE